MRKTLAMAGAMAGMFLTAAGCTPQPAQPVPQPVRLLLPREIRIHPFTGTRTFDEAGGVQGVEVRIEALDAWGDSTKAFGNFHFELYTFRPGSPQPKDKLVNTWNKSLIDPDDNMIHWDGITRAYVFKLQWYQPIPVGERYVLTASFASPFTERLFAEHVFVSGQ